MFDSLFAILYLLTFFLPFIIPIGIILAIYLLIRKPKSPPKKVYYTPAQDTYIDGYPYQQPGDLTNYSQCYQARYLFTKNEWYEHRKLQKYATERNLIICPKVRLLDIIEPRKGVKHYKTLLYKIQSKHVDFVICDANMHLIRAIT